MAIDKDIVNEVHQSLGRCYSHGSFMDRFHLNFKSAHVAVPHELLRESLNRLVMNSGGSQDYLNLHPRLYKFWMDALIKTLCEFDEKFSPELERKWRMVLQESIRSQTKRPA